LNVAGFTCAPEQSTMTTGLGAAVAANPTPEAAIAATAAAPATTPLRTPARFDNSFMIPTRSFACQRRWR
jgi:hypothetical protein